VAPDPEKIRFWEARAAAYDRLCRRWDIFSELSNRLIDLLPDHLAGPVLDIGAGSGLTSELLLARHLHCEVILIEPSKAMLDLARQHLDGRAARFLAMGLDAAPVHDVRAVAAIASASMQFIDLGAAFGRLADVVTPGGHVAFNLWWHHWEETASASRMTRWQAVAEAACREARISFAAAPAGPPPACKTRTQLMNASRRHGFELVAEHRDEYLNGVGFGVDYAAIDADWPVQGFAPDVRQAVLTKMHALAQGQFETLVSTRFLLRAATNCRIDASSIGAHP